MAVILVAPLLQDGADLHARVLAVEGVAHDHRPQVLMGF